MIFSQEQIDELLKIVDSNFIKFTAKALGVEVLTKDQASTLDSIFGFHTSFDEAFLFGRLSSLLQESDTKSISYNDFRKYLERAQYIPLTKVEEYMLSSAKTRTYNHLKGLGDTIKKEINGIILEKQTLSRDEYEKLINKEITEGVYRRKALTEIVSEIGHKTEDWNRNLGRIVETEWNNIFQEGRASEFERKFGKDVSVYKHVYELACRHCIKAYLTKGIGSKPKIFTIRQLEENGTNIGKKVADWLPVLGSMHPFCRCTLQYVPKNYEWDDELKDFKPKKIESKYDKEKVGSIKITVGDKVFEV